MYQRPVFQVVSAWISHSYLLHLATSFTRSSSATVSCSGWAAARWGRPAAWWWASTSRWGGTWRRCGRGQGWGWGYSSSHCSTSSPLGQYQQLMLLVFTTVKGLFKKEKKNTFILIFFFHFTMYMNLGSYNKVGKCFYIGHFYGQSHVIVLRSPVSRAVNWIKCWKDWFHTSWADWVLANSTDCQLHSPRPASIHKSNWGNLFARSTPHFQ